MKKLIMAMMLAIVAAVMSGCAGSVVRNKMDSLLSETQIPVSKEPRIGMHLGRVQVGADGEISVVEDGYVVDGKLVKTTDGKQQYTFSDLEEINALVDVGILHDKGVVQFTVDGQTKTVTLRKTAQVKVSGRVKAFDGGSTVKMSITTGDRQQRELRFHLNPVYDTDMNTYNEFPKQPSLKAAIAGLNERFLERHLASAEANEDVTFVVSGNVIVSDIKLTSVAQQRMDRARRLAENERADAEAAERAREAAPKEWDQPAKRRNP